VASQLSMQVLLPAAACGGANSSGLDASGRGALSGCRRPCKLVSGWFPLLGPLALALYPLQLD